MTKTEAVDLLFQLISEELDDLLEDSDEAELRSERLVQSLDDEGFFETFNDP